MTPPGILSFEFSKDFILLVELLQLLHIPQTQLTKLHKAFL